MSANHLRWSRDSNTDIRCIAATEGAGARAGNRSLATGHT